jgi:2-isopropylmalate synthase
VKLIADTCRKTRICGLSRASKGDIDRCLGGAVRAPRRRASTPSSPPRRCTGHSQDDTRRDGRESHETVTHARRLCDNVQWSPMDATRTEHGTILARVVEIAIEPGPPPSTSPTRSGTPRRAKAPISSAADRERAGPIEDV